MTAERELGEEEEECPGDWRCPVRSAAGAEEEKAQLPHLLKNLSFAAPCPAIPLVGHCQCQHRHSHHCCEQSRRWNCAKPVLKRLIH